MKKRARKQRGVPSGHSSSQEEDEKDEMASSQTCASYTSSTISCSSDGPSTYGTTTSVNESGYDSDVGFYAKLRKQQSQQDSEESASYVSICVAVLMLCLIIATVLWPGYFNAISVQKENEDLFLHYQENKAIYLIGLLSSLCVALALGITCCCFSSVITYFDSLDPGLKPPTPASPTPVKQMSGHSFHISYTMALVNGAVVFAYTLWYNKENFWLL